jgi:Zn-dependent protease
MSPERDQLVNVQAVEQLSFEAKAAALRGDWSEEIRLWREALHLLPADSPHYQAIERRLLGLSRAIDEGAPHPGERHTPKWVKKLGPLAPILLLVWKFKAILLAVLSKGKLLLFGLGKFSTFSSMLVALAAYWAVYGWKFALGLILSIYVHEMGHVYALRRFGFAASAPMFIPFFGAFVRMKQHPSSAVEDARIGLAGPIWGTIGALVAFILYYASEIPVIGVVAHFAAWLNLFNLLPVWQLDGARGMRALNRNQRVLLIVVLGLAWAAFREGFLLILAALAIFRLFTKDAPEQGDSKTLVQFSGLILILATLMAIPLPPAAGQFP